MREPVFLGLAEALYIHSTQIRLYGGETGVRDGRLLESALALPRSGIGGEYFHSDLFSMAAAYLYHIVMNHPFLDGNKRTGITAALVFLELNGYEVRCGNDELTAMVLETAQGGKDKEAIADFFRAHSFRNKT